MTTYYLANSGSPGPGTQAAPWSDPNTLMGFNAKPGDTFLFKRGDKFTVTGAALALYSSAGGTAALPITLGAWGSGPLPQLVSSDAYAAVLLNKPYMIARDLDIRAKGNGLIIDAEGAVVTYVQVMGAGGQGILLKTGSGANISSNYVYQAQASGISIMSAANLTVKTNLVDRCCLDSGANGDLTYDYTAGIKVFGRGGSNILLEQNRVTNNGNATGVAKGVGIWIDSAENGSVLCQYNVVVDNWGTGIVVELCDRQRVIANTAVRNGRGVATNAGIALYRGACHNDVLNNTCVDNPGVLLHGYPGVGSEGLSQLSDWNTILWNTFILRAGQKGVAGNMLSNVAAGSTEVPL